MSGSQSKTATTTQQSTNVQNLNLQDTGGFTAADNKNSNITAVSVSNTTDEGAVSAALSSNTNVTNSALNTATDLGKGAFSLSSDVSQSAIDLGGSAIAAGQQVANAGLDNAAAAYQSGLTFGNNALGLVHDLADEFSSQNASLTAAALSGYQSIAQQNSASQSTQIQKIAIYAIGAAVLLVVLPRIFR